MSQQAKANDTSGLITLDQLIKNPGNIIISGPRESGKSTLAHQIALLTIEGKADVARVPAIIDMRRTPHANDLQKGIQAYLSDRGNDPIGGALLKELRSGFESCDFMICLDNFDLNKAHHISSLRRMRGVKPTAKYVIFCDEQPAINPGFKQARAILGDCITADIQPLSTKLIRRLSKQKLEIRRQVDPDVVDHILKQFRVNDLPRTGYIVSLLLWAWESKLKSERLNEAVLLKAYTDHLLEATDFTSAIRGSFDSKLKTLLLQELANRLSRTDGAEDSTSLQNYLKAFFKTKGLEFDATTVLQTLCTSGMMKLSWNMISFRYRCIQDFFNAQYIAANVDVESFEADYTKIIDISREIDLITSLERKMLGFENVIIGHIQDVFGDSADNVGATESFDKIGFEKGSVQLSGSRLEFLQSLNVTQDALDDLADKVAVQEAQSNRKHGKNLSNNQQNYDAESKSKNKQNSDPEINLKRSEPLTVKEFSALFAMTELLARVVRNSEFEDLDKKERLTIILLGSLVRLFSVVIEKIEKDKDKIKTNFLKTRKGDMRDQVDGIVALCKILFPAFASAQVGESLVSPNIAIVLEGIISKEHLSPDVRLLACLSLIDVGRSTGFSGLQKLLSKDKTDLRSFVALERLTLKFMTTALSADLKNRFTTAISEIEQSIFKYDRRLGIIKGRRIQQLKSQAPPPDE